MSDLERGCGRSLDYDCHCFQCQPWTTIICTPRGSVLGVIPKVKVRTQGPNNLTREWLDATTDAALSRLGADV